MNAANPYQSPREPEEVSPPESGSPRRISLGDAIGYGMGAGIVIGAPAGVVTAAILSGGMTVLKSAQSPESVFDFGYLAVVALALWGGLLGGVFGLFAGAGVGIVVGLLARILHPRSYIALLVCSAGISEIVGVGGGSLDALTVGRSSFDESPAWLPLVICTTLGLSGGLLGGTLLGRKIAKYAWRRPPASA